MLPKTVGNYAVRDVSQADESFYRIQLIALDDTSFARECYVDRAFPFMYAEGYEPLTAHLNAFANYLDKGRECQSN